ncbi:Response regulator MprA [Acaryochloris thomasi RCC1774]|uniref:Response regulator MprA n=1 Tax=Acaryochloris thomasi RCC1774 TaxID=1764569 RepID=A0A2W1JL40_9CYAN|nr:response regulator transcription factor [Acaryochloris thomasi]PZD73906.1 Response regulator MprA [Acaryochloris thomasi RCC1774]
MSSQILLVEDEPRLAQFLNLELTSAGYGVTVCNDGMSGLMGVRQLDPNLVILDWMLPCLSGLELCRRLRQTGSKVPIILLTARNCIADRVAGLDSGADDYLVKPFRVEELLARVRTRLRSFQNPQVLRYSDLALNLESREVLQGTQRVELTVKEFDLLTYFLRNPKSVLSRSQIVKEVWHYEHQQNYNLIHVYISHLRKKLEQHNPRRLIHTVRGYGYILR